MLLKVIMQKYWVYVFFAFFCNVAKAQKTSSEPTTTSTTEVTTTVGPPTIDEIALNDDKEHTWNSPDFPQPYPSRNQDLIIKASDGYSVLVTIDSLDLDSIKGDYLVIKPGPKLESEGKGKVFTYNLKSTRKYLVHSNTVYISLQVVGKNEDGKKGFSLHYQRVGEEKTTTTENPTTVVTYPTPAGGDSIYYTAYTSGKTQEDFKDNQTLLNFKTALAEMATEYCNTNNFMLTENITEQNVHMYYLIQCAHTWPDSETCMKARFALPVFLHANSTWSGYQLTTVHLEQMWIKLARNYLTKYEMDVYSVPDNSSSVRKWIVISCVVLILFLILLYFVKIIGRYFSPMNSGKKRLSDTGGFISNGNKVSNVSLAPHPYQTTPSFFENDYSFDQFEPDVGIPKKTTYTDYSYPLSEDDSDNDIIFSNFSNSRNNVEVVNKESDS